MSKIELRNVLKEYDKQAVVDHMNLSIPEQSFTVILGPSGCGKSTLLRLLSGLEEVDGGEVFIENINVTHLEPKDRKIAMVFQNYALYPHMTAYKNVEYGLKIQKMPKEKRKKVVTDALRLVELEDQANKLPAQMSGGQRQRVALARAIVKVPSVYLFDEPLSNLDARLRNAMRHTISELHRTLQKTFIYVTHDQVEAMSMADHIVILNKGRIMQEGTPKDIYLNPQNLFVATFIGSPPANVVSFSNHYVAIRPEHIFLSKPEQEYLKMEGTIISSEQLGSEVIYNVETHIGKLLVKAENDWKVRNIEMKLYLPFQYLMYFDNKENRVYSKEMEERFKKYVVEKTTSNPQLI